MTGPLLPLAAAASCSPVAGEVAAIEPDLVITDVTVLSGRGDAPIVEVDIAIKDGMIAEIGPGLAEASPANRIIDGRGRYLVPGFIDMHAHLLFPRCKPVQNGGIFDRPLSERALSAMLDSGVTFVRSPANPTGEGLALRNDLNAGRVRGPRAMASAELLNDASLSAEAINRYVREAAPLKPDYFKAYAALSPKQVQALVSAADEVGVPVIGHLQRTSWAKGAEVGVSHLVHTVDWSVESLPADEVESYHEASEDLRGFRRRIAWLEHFDPTDPKMGALIRQLAESRISVDLTLVAYAGKFSRASQENYARSDELTNFPELQADWSDCGNLTIGWNESDFVRWQAAWPKLQMWVRAMADGGVLLVSGTDMTNPWVVPGRALQDEFELLSDAGISNERILRMTGADAAEALGRDDIGIIEAERRADFVLLAGNPLDSIANTRKVIWVMQGGAIVSGTSQ